MAPRADDTAVVVSVDGRQVRVPAGATLVTAVIGSGATRFRRSVTGQPRGPLCGMGICFECRVTVDGTSHVRACMTPCRDGMEVRTDA